MSIPRPSLGRNEPPVRPSTTAPPAAASRDVPDIYRVTDAASAHSVDMDRRMRRYLISMGIRTACVVLAVVVAQLTAVPAAVRVPAMWVFIVGAVVLPYVAVVMANAGRRRRPEGTSGAGTAQPYRPGDGPVITISEVSPGAPEGR